MTNSPSQRRSIRACALKELRNLGVSSLGTCFLAVPLVCAGFILSGGPVLAKSPNPPALVVSNDPLPPALQSKVYSKPRRAPQTMPQDVLGGQFYGELVDTTVGKKVDMLRGELFDLQNRVSTLSEALSGIEVTSQHRAAEYYASVATISTQLQSGTTPGNPRLINKLNVARENLERLSSIIAELNNMAVDISGAASTASYLLESARATYGLSGAVEEDHVRLAQLEDAVTSTVVIIERLLNNVNDDITRTTAYLATERENLRTMALAINTGDMFGKSLSNRPFSSAPRATFTPVAASSYGGVIQPPPMPPSFQPEPENMAPAPMPEPAALPGPSAAPMAPPAPTGVPASPRPLVKIRFDKPDVSFQQPVYMAVNEALNRFPNARFELVAVHPSAGNAAEIAIESTRSRRNAERVLRSLAEMGLPLDRVDLSYTPSSDATTNEVHLYVR